MDMLMRKNCLSMLVLPSKAWHDPVLYCTTTHSIQNTSDPFVNRFIPNISDGGMSSHSYILLYISSLIFKRISHRIVA